MAREGVVSDLVPRAGDLMTPGEQRAAALGWTIWPGSERRAEIGLDDQAVVWVEVTPPPPLTAADGKPGSWGVAWRRILADVLRERLRRRRRATSTMGGSTEPPVRAHRERGRRTYRRWSGAGPAGAGARGSTPSTSPR